MDPKKAIEILKDILHYVKPGDPPDEHDAIRLGIEALLYVERNRLGDIINPDALLPGETPPDTPPQSLPLRLNSRGISHQL